MNCSASQPAIPANDDGCDPTDLLLFYGSLLAERPSLQTILLIRIGAKALAARGFGVGLIRL
jgi:hypothetical protein